MQRLEQIEPLTRFHILFEPLETGESVMLRSAPDGDLATLAFYEERERLRHDRVAGDLLLICHGVEARTLLREPLR